MITSFHFISFHAGPQVRREKISERMKVLQSLVPTCSKVRGRGGRGGGEGTGVVATTADACAVFGAEGAAASADAFID